MAELPGVNGFARKSKISKFAVGYDLLLVTVQGTLLIEIVYIKKKGTTYNGQSFELFDRLINVVVAYSQFI